MMCLFYRKDSSKKYYPPYVQTFECVQSFHIIAASTIEGEHNPGDDNGLITDD